MHPTISLLSNDFIYTPSHQTNIRARFATVPQSHSYIIESTRLVYLTGKIETVPHFAPLKPKPL